MLGIPVSDQDKIRDWTYILMSANAEENGKNHSPG
jgi:hypothetical protein